MRIIAATVALITAIAGVALASYGINEDGVRVIARATVRVSVTLFLLAFVASALYTRFGGTGTAWLIQKRRHIGLSFAIAHYAHLAALIALGVWFYPLREELGPAEVYGGGLAYLLIGLMAVTSNDRSVKLLGPKGWKTLHTVGAWYLWVSFAQAYIPRAFADPTYVPFAAALIAAPVIRVMAWAKRRNAPTASAQVNA